jgi:hypothetical protein
MKGSKPDFLITGAAKSGTTSLAHNLSMHPRVYMPEGEIHFFSKRLGQGNQWYKSLFREPNKVQGEKSPTYLYYKECHREIHRFLPHVKLILLLRDPVERAFSNWTMRYNDNRLIQQGLVFNRKYGNTLGSLDFDKLLDFYLDNRAVPQVFEKPLDVFHRGLYIRQIESLLLFYHREQLLILITERFFKDEQKGYDEVCRFLSIPPFKKRRFERQRVGDYKKEMPRKSWERLREFYLPYNRELFELLGESIQEWQ